VKKGRVAVTVSALGKEDHVPAFLERLTGILHRLMRLDHVYVFGKASARHDHQIGTLLKRKGEIIRIEAATVPVRGSPVTCKCGDYPLPGRKHRVQDEVGVYHGAGFFHSSMHRVVIQVAGGRKAVLAAPLTRIKHVEVTCHAGCATCHPGKEAFSSPAEPGKVVKPDRAGKNEMISFGNGAVDGNFDAAGCNSDCNELAGVVAFVVNNPDPAVKRAGYFSMLRFTLLPVDSESYYNRDAVIGYTCRVEPFHQQRQIDLAAGIAGDVRSDNYHFSGWPDRGNPLCTAIQGSRNDLLG